MTPVFELAEIVARKIGIEQIRVDVFIRPTDPQRPVVNEISLASGVLYRFHSRYMARIWIDGHIKRGKTPAKVYSKTSTPAFGLMWWTFISLVCSLVAFASFAIMATGSVILFGPLFHLTFKYAVDIITKAFVLDRKTLKAR